VVSRPEHLRFKAVCGHEEHQDANDLFEDVREAHEFHLGRVESLLRLVTLVYSILFVVDAVASGLGQDVGHVRDLILPRQNQDICRAVTARRLLVAKQRLEAVSEIATLCTAACRGQRMRCRSFHRIAEFIVVVVVTVVKGEDRLDGGCIVLGLLVLGGWSNLFRSETAGC